MKEFFEYLNKIGIKDSSRAKEVIYKLSPNKLIGLGETCCELINSSRPASNPGSLFNFSANTSLSGGTRPCSCIECRLKNVYNLSVFAVLYSDTVLIPNFFDHFHHQKFNFKNKDEEGLFYNEVLGNISVLLEFKPLIENGLIQINPNYFRLCDDCLAKVKNKERKLERNLNLIGKKLEKKLMKKIKFTLDTPISLVTKDEEGYTDHEVIRFLNLPEEFRKYIRKIPYTFNDQEVRRLGLLEKLVFIPTFNDLALQKYSINTEALSYLTNRKIDSLIIENIQNRDKTHRRALVEGFAHSLPFIQGARIEDLLKLRQEEGLSFEVYRNAVRNAIKETRNEKKEKVFKDAVNDIILPEVIKIENKIDKNKKYFYDRAKKKIKIASTALTIGLFGLDLSLPAVGTVLLAAGISSKVIKDFVSASTIPKEARENDYYFLWKTKEKIRNK